MSPEELIKSFDVLAEATDGIQRLRELVLQLAVRGKLVEQDPGDEPAWSLLDNAKAEKDELIKAGHFRSEKISLEVDDPVPFELPESWAWVTLGQIALYNGRPKVKPESIDESTWLLDLEDIEKTSSRLLNRARIADRQSRSTKALFSKGDVLYGKLRPYLDKVLIADQEGACTTEIVPIIPLAGICPEWIRWSLKRPDFLKFVESISYGVKMPRLGTKDAITSLHPLPPLAEQHRIVAKVDELMALIDDLEAARDEREATRTQLRDSALQALQGAENASEVESAWQLIADHMDELFTKPEDVEPLRQTILQLAVRGKLVEQDPGDEPASELLHRIRNAKKELVPKKHQGTRLNELSPECEIANLPKGWQQVVLGELLVGTSAGWSPKCLSRRTNNPIEWGIIKTTAIQINAFHEEHHKALPTSLDPRPEIEIKPGDLLVTRAGPWFRVGVAAFVEKCRAKLMLSDKVIRCEVVGDEMSRSWLALSINTGPGFQFLRSKQTGMDKAQVNISQSRLKATPILVPPLAEQHRIVTKVDALMALCDDLEQNLIAQSQAESHFAESVVKSGLDMASDKLEGVQADVT